MKDIYNQMLAVVLIAGIISCKKPNVIETPQEPIKINIQFVDYTSGAPINNLQVKRWNHKESGNMGNYISYKDSLLTDADGNCSFEKSEANEYIGWNSVEYFDDYLESVYGNGIAQNNSLYFIKKQGNTRYYQAKLFPKIEVTVHIKQLTPIQPDSTSYGTFLNLSVLAYNNGIARNEISLVTEKNFLPECYSCSENYNHIQIKENELLDIKIKGFLIKNLFNNLKFSVFSSDYSFFPIIIKQGILPIESRIIGPQTEIFFTF